MVGLLLVLIAGKYSEIAIVRLIVPLAPKCLDRL
jgi:hypothetical protein